MVLEQVLTIIFALAVVAALVIYATRPRHRVAPISVGHSTVGSFTPAEVAHSEPSPHAAAVEAPPVETSSPEVQALVEAASMTTGAAVEAIDVAPVPTTVVEEAPTEQAAVADVIQSPPRKAASRRGARKRSTAAKTHRPSRRTKKS